MNAFSRINSGTPEDPVLALIEMPWGFRIRPADMEASALDAIVEWGLTLLGVAFILAAFGQWVLPASLYVGDAIMVKFVLTCILGLAGGVSLAVSARGFRPEVQIDRVRHEIRFVSRNPRGRGQILATVDLDRAAPQISAQDGAMAELLPPRYEDLGRIGHGGRAGDHAPAAAHAKVDVQRQVVAERERPLGVLGEEHRVCATGQLFAVARTKIASPGQPRDFAQGFLVELCGRV